MDLKKDSIISIHLLLNSKAGEYMMGCKYDKTKVDQGILEAQDVLKDFFPSDILDGLSYDDYSALVLMGTYALIHPEDELIHLWYDKLDAILDDTTDYGLADSNTTYHCFEKPASKDELKFIKLK